MKIAALVFALSAAISGSAAPVQDAPVDVVAPVSVVVTGAGGSLK